MGYSPGNHDEGCEPPNVKTVVKWSAVIIGVLCGTVGGLGLTILAIAGIAQYLGVK